MESAREARRLARKLVVEAAERRGKISRDGAFQVVLEGVPSYLLCRFWDWRQATGFRCYLKKQGSRRPQPRPTTVDQKRLAAARALSNHAFYDIGRLNWAAHLLE